MVKHNLTVPKDNGRAPSYVPTTGEIDEAVTVRKAIRAVFRTGDTSMLGPSERKSLSSFSFGANNFILPPQKSEQVLSCLVDPSDLSGLVNRVNISGPSI